MEHDEQDSSLWRGASELGMVEARPEAKQVKSAWEWMGRNEEQHTGAPERGHTSGRVFFEDFVMRVVPRSIMVIWLRPLSGTKLFICLWPLLDVLIFYI